jgi:hypothetical protein
MEWKMDRKKTIEMPKFSDPLLVVMDEIIEFGKWYDEWLKKQGWEKEKIPVKI